MTCWSNRRKNGAIPNGWTILTSWIESGKQQLATGTPADWLTETHAVCEKIYEDTPEDSELSYQYMFDNYPVVEQQLLWAGLRLADILNSIYK
ncbi:MAG: S1/P1 nuclease [Alistipes indistinctus]